LISSIALLWVFRPTFLYDGDFSYVIIKGESMRPTLEPGDFAILRRADNYSINDIVAYIEPYYNQVIIHRIVGKGISFILKGDNRDQVDPWTVTSDMILGRLIFSVPYIGFVFDYLKAPLRLAIAITVIFLISSLPDIISLYREEQKRIERRRRGL
jgi:signal peptidase